MDQAITIQQAYKGRASSWSYDQPPKNGVKKSKMPSLEQIRAFQDAYQYFEKALFIDPLPPIIFSFNRKSRSNGYYKPKGWVDKENKTIPEINLNPELLWLEPKIIFSTLVHEICHHFHYCYGQPGINGYHNIEFSQIMLMVGLVCSATGQPGGRITGYKMSHYVIPGGPFEEALLEMPENFLAPFKPVLEIDNGIINPKKVEKTKKEKIQKNKVKYSCVECSNVTVWGRPNLNIICGNCNLRLAIIEDFGKTRS